MTSFRTELKIDENPDKIEYNSRIMSFGSGFSNLLTDHFKLYGLNVSSNPYGNIYNPLSIFDAISRTINKEPVFEEHLSNFSGSWRHFDYHSSIQDSSEHGLIDRLKGLTDTTHKKLMNTDFLFITLGSAYAYKYVETNKIIANCQQAPQNKFDKKLLSVEDIVEGFRSIYKSLNHVKNIVLIVSPIMHTGDSITLNAVSKSTLRLACHHILSEFPYVKYFPAYEFLLSDLRDYRFYQKDHIHPTEEAMDYIFDQLVDSYVAPDTKKTIQDIQSIIEELVHSPYSPQSDRYQKSVSEAIEQINGLQNDMNLELLKSKLGVTT